MPHPSRRMVVKCFVCEKEKSIPLAQYNRCKSKEFFCSSPSVCKTIWHTKLVNHICSNCNVTFQVQPFKLQKYENTFCSKKCSDNYQVTKQSVKCDYCGKDIQVHPCKIKYYKNHFCDSTCSGNWKSKNTMGENSYSWKRIKTNCAYCGKEIEDTPCMIKTYKHRFCSSICRTSWRIDFYSKENHYNWQGGISNNPYPSEFNETLRESIRDRDGRKCQWCGKTELENKQKLDVHHVNFLKDDCNPNNLVSLCHGHHTNTSSKNKRQVWINMFTFLMALKEKQTRILTYSNL